MPKVIQPGRYVRIIRSKQTAFIGHLGRILNINNDNTALIILVTGHTISFSFSDFETINLPGLSTKLG